MRTRIVKWGNSLGLRIPKAFAADLGVGAGTPVELAIEDGRLILQAVTRPSYDLADLLEGVTPENLHTEIGTGAPVGREEW